MNKSKNITSGTLGFLTEFTLHVTLQLVLPAEGLITVLADERPVAAVQPVVSLQVRGVRKLPLAHGTLEGLLLGMLPQVLIIVAPVGEVLIAKLAH